MEKSKQLTIYEVSRTAIIEDSCGGFKDPATLAFGNAENERITEINE